jgi:putative DNA methylase
MPNHVHAVVETVEGFSNASVIHSWKSFTAHEANKILKREGVFWQREYYDREVRDGDHFERLVLYVENNPVKAGLVPVAEDWAWTSARRDRRKHSMRTH